MAVALPDRVHPRELAAFCRQFSTMSQANINLLDILRTLTQQTENDWFRRILTSVRRDVEYGRSLASAFSRFPADFSPFFIQMVRQGEAEGVLGEVFRNLAQHLEREAETSPLIRRLLPGGLDTTALRSRPLLFWISVILAGGLLSGGGLWFISLAGLLPPQYLGPELCLLAGVCFLAMALVFIRFLLVPEVQCSFCGKAKSDSVELVTGQGVAICDSCIAFGVRQLREKPGGPGRVSPLMPEPEADKVVEI